MTYEQVQSFIAIGWVGVAALFLIALAILLNSWGRQ